MLSITIPTMNRSDFLTRLLYYYADTGYKHWICIGDSSNSFHMGRTKSVIKKLEGNLKIIYREYPDLNGHLCLKELLKTAKTPYTVYSADDDFLVPRVLERCIDFLENNKNYIGANGYAVLSILRTSGAHGQFQAVGAYKQKSIEAKSASQRLLKYFQDYFVTLFSVHRTEAWARMYRDTYSIVDRAFGGEVLPSSLSVIQGNIKQLDCLYLVRQVHDRRSFMLDMYEWFTNPNWLASYQVCRDSLVEALMQQDGINKKNAQEVVKQAIWSLLKIGFNRGFQRQYCISPRERIKRRLKRIPALVACVRLIRPLVFSSKDMSLPALLSKHSPYHGDFMPIYHSVTGVAGTVKNKPAKNGNKSGQIKRFMLGSV